MPGISANIPPKLEMAVLSQQEVAELQMLGAPDVQELFRRCALAVLNTGSDLDDGQAVLDAFRDFNISVLQQDRGIKLSLENAPENAFVDGRIIDGIREHLFSALRDIVYVRNQIERSQRFDLNSGEGITSAVFHILRNAGALRANEVPNMVVCWGGHSISREEYDYSKEVGHQLGLRGMDVCTGCGPGAMKGPMKGATIGHAKQRIENGRYVGISEPGIIAAEAPNPIVSELIIMPDIEKRLEAFVRTGHAIIVFPGGAGTAEELLYLLGILLADENADIPFPLILTGPASAAEYWQSFSEFLAGTLGDAALARCQLIVDDPAGVAKAARDGISAVHEYRRRNSDAWYFNWRLSIHPAAQQPFEPTHENMAALKLDPAAPRDELAGSLRAAFSGIVAGNVKAEGIRQVEDKGPYQLRGDPKIMALMDELLCSFIDQQRMKLPGTTYQPCYELKR